MKEIVAILGDFYHNEEIIKRSLHRAINNLGDVNLRFIDIDELQKELESKPDCVILFKENRLNPQSESVNLWMTEEIEKKIVNYVKDGGSLFAWHSGLSSYPEDGEYNKMLKGYFLHHPEKNDVVQYAPQKDVIKEFESAIEPFEFVDEHYFVKCEENDTNVFLRSFSKDGQSIAGWYHHFGKGKVCCLTPAHREDGLLNESFLKTLHECVNWCIK